jgi:hypothetical protein
MTKVLIDREVVYLAADRIREYADGLQHFADRVKLRAVAGELEEALATATPMPALTYNASDVCAPCWTRNHEQPLGPGEPPCECPCHGIKPADDGAGNAMSIVRRGVCDRDSEPHWQTAGCKKWRATE